MPPSVSPKECPCVSDKPPVRSRWLNVVPAIAASLLVIAGCTANTDTRLVPNFFPPHAATEQGQLTNDLYTIVFWTATAIFLLVEVLILWSVLRFRRGNDDTLPAQTHGNR